MSDLLARIELIKRAGARSLPVASGVYGIVSLQRPGIYVGKSSNLKIRVQAHSNELRLSKHVNRGLQAAWNEDGAESMVFGVLEFSDSNDEMNRLEAAFTVQAFALGIAFNTQIINPASGSPTAGRTPLPPDQRRTGRISMRTYPDLVEKARSMGTEAFERMILEAKE